MKPFRSFVASLGAALLACVLLGATASAQDTPLERLAPAESLVALGWQPSPVAFDALPRAFEAVDVEGAAAGWEALRAYLGDAEADPESILREVAGPFVGDMLADGLRPVFDALGGDGDRTAMHEEAAEAMERICPGSGAEFRNVMEAKPAEALLAVGASASRPMPAAVLLTHFEGEGLAAAEALHATLADCSDREPLLQDGQPIHLLDTGNVPLAVTRADDTFALSTDPEALRGVLRRAQGSGEPSLADRGVGRALTGMDAGGMRLGVNVAAIAELGFQTLGTPSGAEEEALLQRMQAAAQTLAGVAMRVAPTADGLTVDSVLAVPADAPDAELAALLRCDGCPTAGVNAVPGSDPAAASGHALNLEAMVAYVDGWLADLAEAGAPVPGDLRTWLQQEAGLDLDVLLLDWIGTEAQSVRLQPFSPDVRSWTGMRGQAWSVDVTSEAAARDGLDAWETLVQDEMEANEEFAGQVAIRDGRVGDLAYRRVQVGPTLDLVVGVAGGRLLVAGDESTYVRVADAARNERTPAAAIAELHEALPDTARGWSYAQPGRDLMGVADTLGALTQPLASGAAAALQQMGASTGRAVTEAPAYPDPYFDADAFGGGSAGGGPVVPGDAEPTPLSVPDNVEAELGDGETATVRGDDADLYRLEGVSAGDRVEVTMTSDPVDTYLYWVQPGGGAILASNDDAPDTSTSRLAFEVPESGEVWIAASSFAGFSSGPYALEATLLDEDAQVELMTPMATGPGGAAFDPESVDPEPLAAPGRVDGDLGDADTVIDGKDTVVYRLEGLTPGAEVSVEMTSEPIDTYLFLLDPSAPAIVGENDDAGGTNRSAVRFTVPESGEVWIGASAYFGGSGPYRVNVSVDGVGPDDVADEAAEEEAEEEEAAPPTFAELLPLMEVGPDALRALASTLGDARGVRAVEDGFVQNRWELDVDW